MQTKLKTIFDNVKDKKIMLIVSAIYNFVWAICKIVFGVLSAAYFFCISGASTLLFGFTKRIYLKNYKSENNDEKLGKSITISILLIISSLFFTFYMARLFFTKETQNYGLIMSITIAAFSFTELVLSLIEFFKAKKIKDILLQCFKGCSLASSCFAIVLTQVALLSAQGVSANFYNALTGILFGVFSIFIGIYLLYSCKKEKQFD